MFIYELSCCVFESNCSSLIFRCNPFFELRVPWHLNNYRVGSHSEKRKSHHKNRQSNPSNRQVLTNQLNHSVSLGKCLSLCLRTKWLWVRVQLKSFTIQMSHNFEVRSSLTFRQLESVDSLWHAYVTWQEHTVKWTVPISTHNSLQSLGQFGQMVDCSFLN